MNAIVVFIIIILVGIGVGIGIWGVNAGLAGKQVCYDNNYTGLEYHLINSNQYVCYNDIIINGTKITKLYVVET